MGKRFATCLICDDVRYEVSNKTSVVGLYGTELIVRELPITLAQLCFLTSVFTEYDDPVKALTVRVSYAGETLNVSPVEQDILEEWARIDYGVGVEEVEEFSTDEPPRIRFSVQMTTSPFTIAKEGRLSVHVETEEETLRAGSLKIKLAQAAT